MNPRFSLILLGFCAAVVSLAQNLYVPLLPQLQEDLHTTFYLVNLTVSLFTIALAVMQVVLGPLIDLKGRKPILLPGMALYAVASIGCVFATSVTVLLIFRILQGIGAAAVPLVAATMIGDMYEGKERAKNMATYQMILGIAPAVGPLIGGFIGSQAGYPGAFLFLSVSASLMFILAATVLPETKISQSGASRKNFTLKSMTSIFSNKTGAAVLLVGFVLYYMFYNFIVFLPDLLTHRYHLDAREIGWVFLMLMSFSFVGSKFSGKLQARMGTVPSLILTCLLALASLASFILLAENSLFGLLAALAAVGFTAGLTMSVPPTLLTEEFVEGRATAIGLYNFIRYLGMAAAPLVGSLLYETGGTVLMFGCTALLMGLTTLSAHRLLRSAATGHAKLKRA
ncbi:MFS transporter [Paenibacillus sp. J22TS3]|uniref:MFS transporter n=1 Tax=Paenibacillus sp. J22TS3 TaxID=2807192 RepID=UPI001B05F997|nr:MFS transporter [Paenibacillus sp. J22TS3]GIP22105.1 MFS transporter [Paenibacillus sp. J22TS3]